MWPVVTAIPLPDGRTWLLTSYALAAMVAAAVAALLAPWRARRMGLPSYEGLHFVGLAVVGGLLGARLAFVLFNVRHFIEAPWTALANEGGVVWYGGLAGGAIAIVLYARRFAIPLAPVADLAAPILALTHGIGRIGCFLAGCCYGAPTQMPWGVRFPESAYFVGHAQVALHPVQLYEAAFEFFLAAILFAWGSRPRGGRVLLAYLAAYAPFRFAMEMLFRGDDRGTLGIGVPPSGVVSAGIVGVLGLLLVRSRGRSPVTTAAR